jgi:NB-ARC domain
VDGGLAGAAVTVLVQLFQYVAGRTGEQLADRAANGLTETVIERGRQLYDAIDERLGRRDDREGLQLLDELQRNPDRRDLQQAAVELIGELLTDRSDGAGLGDLIAAATTAEVRIEGDLNQQAQFAAAGSQVNRLDQPEITLHFNDSPPARTRPGDLVQQGLFTAGGHQVNFLFEQVFRIEQQRRSETPPRQLPSVPAFFDRRDETRRVVDWLQRRSNAVRVVVITGMPGVGKSWLAFQAGHELAQDQYPDMQLLVTLSELGREPATAEDALGRVLEQLGVETIPATLDDRRKRYLAELAGKRVLVVLDGATTAGQVRALLPPAGCGVLVTAHRELYELVVDGAEPLRLQPFSRLQSIKLLVDRLGRPRVARDPLGARKLVRLCGGMPLALAIVSAELRVESGRFATLRDAGNRLEREWTRLEGMATGDRSVAAALSFRVGLLHQEEHRVLTMAGLLNLPTWT